jgi:type II secretory pathway pseudopilin PulG
MKKGTLAFTLIELLVVIGLIMTLSLLVLPNVVLTDKDQKLENGVYNVTSILFRQQQNAVSSKDNKSYGIHIENGQVYEFIGGDYSSAESTDLVNLEGAEVSEINLGGADDIVFANGSLISNVSGNFVVTNGVSSYRVYINSEGLIYSEKL